MKQVEDYINAARNASETTSLKALALQALARNNGRNKSETEPNARVSSTATHETSVDDYDYFSERAAIAEYDGGLTSADAEAQAFTELGCRKNWMERKLHTLFR